MSSEVVLVSQDGERFRVPRNAAFLSELVRTMIGDEEEEENEVPLLNVKADVLRKVVEYCRYHADHPAEDIQKPLKSNDMREVVCEWDAEFVSVEQEMLFELILAANYMDIKSLLDLTCAKVASMIKGI